MSLMKNLEDCLDKEIEGTKQPEQKQDNINELYEQMIEKKFNDMELRLNASMKKLIESSHNTTPTDNKVEEGEKKDDSNTD